MIQTKEYPKDNEVVINEITINYSQQSEITDEDNSLELSITHQGAGFYYVMKSERWAFESIEEIIKVLEDFKKRSGII